MDKYNMTLHKAALRRAAQVRKLMQKHGLNRSQAAKAMGVSHTVVWRLLKNTNKAKE